MSEPIYVLYRHTSPSGKAYIGITKDYTRRSAEHQRADGSCAKFHRAIRKYGWDAFTHDILLEGLTVDEASELETACITKWDTHKHGYNGHPGGMGVYERTENWCKTQSEILSGRVLDEEHIVHIAASCAAREQTLETKIKAYMARHKKTREEAEEYYRKKSEDPSSVNKYYGRPYVGYGSTKQYRQRERDKRMGMLTEPDTYHPRP